MFKPCPRPQCPGGTLVPHHRLRSATARRDAEHSRPRPRPRPRGHAVPAAPTRPSLAAYGIPAALNAHGGAQGAHGIPQGWLQSTPETPSYRQRHAPKPTIHANGMPAATSGARGPDPIPASDSRTGPFGRPPPRVPANRAQPGKAEYHGSLMMTGRSHSRAHTDSSVPLVPNPISMSNSRTDPRKQAIRQTDTIRTHPKTAESQCFRNPVNQERSRLRSHARIESDFDVQSPNQSAETGGPTGDRNPHSS